MRAPIVLITLLTIVLAGCGAPPEGAATAPDQTATPAATERVAQIPTAAPTADQTALQPATPALADTTVATATMMDDQHASATSAAGQPTPQASAPTQPPTPTVERDEPTATTAPELQDVPVAPVPNQLSGIILPSTREEAAALFRNMPSSVAGQDRDALSSILGPDLMQIGYVGMSTSEPHRRMTRISLGASNRPEDRPMPDWNGAQVIAALARGELADRVTAWGRDGHLYWLRGVTSLPSSHDPEPEQILLLGTDTSTWLFSLNALTSEELDALAEALADAL